MQRLTFLFIISISCAALPVQAAVVYDFAADGNFHEAGYATFDSVLHPHPFMPGGLEISASNGGGLASVPFGMAPGSSTTDYPHMDGNWKQDAGLGVCKMLINSCGSDDNQMPGEYICMDFVDEADNPQEVAIIYDSRNTNLPCLGDV